MNSIRTSAEDAREAADKSLFEAISNDIATDGYSVRCNVLGPDLLAGLSSHVQNMDPSSFKKAGVGRKQQHSLNNLVRTDEICWISGDSEAESAWIKWAESLQRYLNRSMFLGLFSFESHFAHYAKGDFYKKHQDSFKGEANRVLSIVVYLNKEWLADDGGEL
ncbi:MAG: SM-20-related protein, partial [Gammaproteobacteria bacterium]